MSTKSDGLEPWPSVVLDPLDALHALNPHSKLRRNPALFPPLKAVHGSRTEIPGTADEISIAARRKRSREGARPVENEPGLCTHMELTYQHLCSQEDTAFVSRWRLSRLRGGVWQGGVGISSPPDASADATADCRAPIVAPTLPPIARLVHAQRYRPPLRRVDASLFTNSPICPPLLFSALVCNRSCERERSRSCYRSCYRFRKPSRRPSAARDEEEGEGEAEKEAETEGEKEGETEEKEETVILHALGTQWLIPPRSAFALLPLERWSELALPALLPEGGYRLILADPPWHSKSVQRAGAYATMDKRELLRNLAPCARLAADDGCLVGVWVTNSLAVQRFVEEALFPAWGARPIGVWYWLKVDSRGELLAGKGSIYSPHRKPWEPLLWAYIGAGVPPPLAHRKVVCSVPLKHSAKPPLDELLRPYTHQLLGEGGGEASGSEQTRRAWQALPKLELFARELRPGWSAVGDEALRFQHIDWWTPTKSIEETEGCRNSPETGTRDARGSS